ncbi:oligosaccharide flippase family protein [Deinococcus aquiradiocola]|uniref:oligosaccharide flippase family protein n=1 Tax=Deinococcus aquiradiocola TaxID=393059 RepID=UPI00166718BB|nr:oligosaccharide flippase family protein [Deinococcus aquiradiocola]
MNLSIGIVSYLITILVPIVSMPIIGKELSKNDIGIYFSFISLSTLVSIIVDFGYSISGFANSNLESISMSLSKMKINRVIGSLLSFFTLSIYAICFRFDFIDLCLVFILSCLLGFSNLWYFQTLNKMDVFYKSEILGKLLILFLYFFFKKYIESYTMAIIFFIMGTMASHIYLFFFHPELYNFRNLSIVSKGFKTIQPSSLLTRLIINSYVNANTVILSWFLAPHLIAGFGAAERIFRASSGIATPVYNQRIIRIKLALKTSGLEVERILLRDAAMLFLCGSIMGIALYFSTSMIANFIFKSSPEGFAANLHILCVVIPFAVCNGFVGLRWMVLVKREKEFTHFVITAAIINLITILYQIKIARSGLFGLGLLLGEFSLFILTVGFIIRGWYEKDA